MRWLTRFLTEVFFPTHCLSCARLGSFVCLACSKALSPVDKDICPYCRKGSLMGLTHSRCRTKYGVDGLKSFYYYRGPLRRIIKTIKYRLSYRGLKEFLEVLALSCADEILFYKKHIHADYLIPVPLHPRRLNQRGFNQSALIAQFFSSLLGIPVKEHLLIRIKNIPPQVRYRTTEERKKNVAGAFDIAAVSTGDLKGKKIIIVDDIYTSGGTVKEITRVLKQSGTKDVYVLTLGR